MASLTSKGRDGLIWENLDGKTELLGHLEVILPIGINLVEIGRTKWNQLDHIIKRNLSWPIKQQTYTNYFLASKNVPVCFF